MHWRKQYLASLFILSSLSSGTTYSEVNDAASKLDWTYTGKTGPTRWHKLSPEFVLCAKGKRQSPINISKKPTRAPAILQINYIPAAATIVTDGTTHLLIGTTQTIIDDGHGVQVNFSSTANETILFNNETYHLKQFHMHTPSENKLHGQVYPMEIHFVHQGENGKVAVIGVFAQINGINTEMEKVVNNIPTIKGVEQPIKGKLLQVNALLPKNRPYYHFMGSLTTPPCTEGLSWIVMDEPITVSSDQIIKLKMAAGGPNARPTQPLNNRPITFTE